MLMRWRLLEVAKGMEEVKAGWAMEVVVWLLLWVGDPKKAEKCDPGLLVLQGSIVLLVRSQWLIPM